MDRLIDELVQLVEDLDGLAAIDCGEGSEYCEGKTAAYWLSADWLREIIKGYTDKTA